MSLKREASPPWKEGWDSDDSYEEVSDYDHTECAPHQTLRQSTHEWKPEPLLGVESTDQGIALWFRSTLWGHLGESVNCCCCGARFRASGKIRDFDQREQLQITNFLGHCRGEGKQEGAQGGHRAILSSLDAQGLNKPQPSKQKWDKLFEEHSLVSSLPPCARNYGEAQGLALFEHRVAQGWIKGQQEYYDDWLGAECWLKEVQDKKKAARAANLELFWSWQGSPGYYSDWDLAERCRS
jgi:hypothetical protein